MALSKTMENKLMLRIRLAATAAFLAATCTGTVWADTAAPPPPTTFEDARGGMFPQQTGEAIYKGVCQGCHMPDAMGAVGAGAYPALAKNTHLETAGYPVGIVIHGQKAMPPFADYFTDTQIANVVNYVRTNFGNRYTDKVKPADVKALR
jgi:mono/diheme cytochrome c family protein